MSEKKYGEPWEADGAGLVADCNGNTLVECNCEVVHIDKEYRDRMILCVNACANRSESEIKAAFALYDNREKVVEKMTRAKSLANDIATFGGDHHDSQRLFAYCAAALALLQAEKEGDA